MKIDLKSLNEVTSFISRGITPSYSDEGVVVINQRCIRNNVVSFSNSRKTNPKIKRISSEKYLKENDILINSTGVGTLGRSAQINELKEKTTVDSHVTIARPNKIMDPNFFKYAIQYKEPDIESLAEGSTGQTELSRIRLGDEIFIPYFSLDTQRKMGQILSFFDQKIRIKGSVKNFTDFDILLVSSYFHIL